MNYVFFLTAYHPDNLFKYLVIGIWYLTLIWEKLDSSAKGDKWLRGNFSRLSIHYLIVELKLSV